MSKFTGNLFAICLSFGLGWLVLINGWGMQPKSWAWIVWGSLGSAFVGAIVSVANDSK